MAKFSPSAPKWAPPGTKADPLRHSFDLKSGKWLGMGQMGTGDGMQYNAPAGFDPNAPKSPMNLVVSPPGTPADPKLPNFTPATGEVSAPGMQAPVDFMNLTYAPQAPARPPAPPKPQSRPEDDVAQLMLGFGVVPTLGAGQAVGVGADPPQRSKPIGQQIWESMPWNQPQAPAISTEPTVQAPTPYDIVAANDIDRRDSMPLMFKDRSLRDLFNLAATQGQDPNAFNAALEIQRRAKAGDPEAKVAYTQVQPFYFPQDVPPKVMSPEEKAEYEADLAYKKALTAKALEGTSGDPYSNSQYYTDDQGQVWLLVPGQQPQLQQGLQGKATADPNVAYENIGGKYYKVDKKNNTATLLEGIDYDSVMKNDPSNWVALNGPDSSIYGFNKATRETMEIAKPQPKVRFEGGNMYVPQGAPMPTIEEYQAPTTFMDPWKNLKVGGGQAAAWTPPVPRDRVVGTGNRFGEEVSMEGIHKGFDLQAYEGEPAVSPVNGTVVKINFDAPGLGLQVMIEDDATGEIHELNHLLENSEMVEEGQHVEAGERVASVGSSGGGSTGPHMDYRIQSPTGEYENPEERMPDIAAMPMSPDTVGEDDPERSMMGMGQAVGRGNGPRDTASLSNPKYGTGRYPVLTLQDIYDLALDAGLSDDEARVAMAIAKTEGGLSGAAGDNGMSFGPFQFYGGGGQLNNYAKQGGFRDWQQAGEYVRNNPEDAVLWALKKGGYLGDAIRRGKALGKTGGELATYAQETGQVSITPERAGQNYDALFGPSSMESAFADNDPAVRRARSHIPASSMESAYADRAYDVGRDMAQQASVPPQKSNTPAWVGDPNLGGALTRHVQQFGGNVTDAWRDFSKPQGEAYRESALGMARKGFDGWDPRTGSGQAVGVGGVTIIDPDQPAEKPKKIKTPKPAQLVSDAPLGTDDALDQLTQGKMGWEDLDQHFKNNTVELGEAKPVAKKTVTLPGGAKSPFTGPFHISEEDGGWRVYDYDGKLVTPHAYSRKSAEGYVRSIDVVHKTDSFPLQTITKVSPEDMEAIKAKNVQKTEAPKAAAGPSAEEKLAKATAIAAEEKKDKAWVKGRGMTAPAADVRGPLDVFQDSAGKWRVVDASGSFLPGRRSFSSPEAAKTYAAQFEKTASIKKEGKPSKNGEVRTRKVEAPRAKPSWDPDVRTVMGAGEPEPVNGFRGAPGRKVTAPAQSPLGHLSGADNPGWSPDARTVMGAEEPRAWEAPPSPGDDVRTRSFLRDPQGRNGGIDPEAAKADFLKRRDFERVNTSQGMRMDASEGVPKRLAMVPYEAPNTAPDVIEGSFSAVDDAVSGARSRLGELGDTLGKWGGRIGRVLAPLEGPGLVLQGAQTLQDFNDMARGVDPSDWMRDNPVSSFAMDRLKEQGMGEVNPQYGGPRFAPGEAPMDKIGAFLKSLGLGRGQSVGMGAQWVDDQGVHHDTDNLEYGNQGDTRYWDGKPGAVGSTSYDAPEGSAERNVNWTVDLPKFNTGQVSATWNQPRFPGEDIIPYAQFTPWAPGSSTQTLWGYGADGQLQMLDKPIEAADWGANNLLPQIQATGTAQPGTAQPGTAQPGTAQPGATQNPTAANGWVGLDPAQKAQMGYNYDALQAQQQQHVAQLNAAMEQTKLQLAQQTEAAKMNYDAALKTIEANLRMNGDQLAYQKSKDMVDESYRRDMAQIQQAQFNATQAFTAQQNELDRMIQKTQIDKQYQLGKEQLDAQVAQFGMTHELAQRQQQLDEGYRQQVMAWDREQYYGTQAYQSAEAEKAFNRQMTADNPWLKQLSGTFASYGQPGGAQQTPYGGAQQPQQQQYGDAQTRQLQDARAAAAWGQPQYGTAPQTQPGGAQTAQWFGASGAPQQAGAPSGGSVGGMMAAPGSTQPTAQTSGQQTQQQGGTPSWDQFKAMNPYQKAAMYADQNMKGISNTQQNMNMVGAWGQQGGPTSAPQTTALNAAGMGMTDKVNTDMVASAFGQNTDDYWNQQKRSWTQAGASNVSQGY